MKKGQKMPPGSVLKGSKKWNAKLNEDQIPEIRKLIEAGKSRQWIAMRFGVVKGIITKIHLGNGWTHV
jgi:DNA invertase Pin-like site-specific DNA recombinase